MRIKYKARIILHRILVTILLLAMVLNESQLGNMTIRSYASGTIETGASKKTTDNPTGSKGVVATASDATEEAATTEAPKTTESTGATETSGTTETATTTESPETAEATATTEAPDSTLTQSKPELQGNTVTAEDMIVNEDTTLTADATVGNLEIQKGNELNLNGYVLTVEGNSTIKGSLRFCKGELVSMGDINISSDAHITMDNANDYMIAYGDVTYYGESNLTSGVIEVKGDFTANNSFTATASHKVIFSGDSQQNVSVSDGGNFNNVEIRNFSSAGINILYSFNYAQLTDNGCAINYADMEGERGYTLTEDAEIDGTYYLVSDILNLDGHTMTIHGDLIQAGGTINVNGGKLIVHGDYRVQQRTVKEDKTITYGKSSGALVMTQEEDYIYVDGDFISESAVDHTGKLTAGVMEITGDVSVSDKNSTYAFVSTQEHTVILSGEEPQDISVSTQWTTSSYNYSQIRNLKITNSSEEGICFSSVTYVSGNVSVGSGRVSGLLGCGYETYFEDEEYNGDIVSIGNSAQFSQPMTINGNLYISNNFRTKGNLTVNGNVSSYDAKTYHLIPGTYSVYVSGDSTNVSYNMQSESEYVYIGGNLTGGDITVLNKGTLELKGDLNVTKYKAASAHKTILSGDKLQNIHNGGNVTFGTIEIKNYSEEGVCSDVPFVRTTLIRNNCNLRYGNLDGKFGWTLTEDYVCDGDFILLDDTLDLNGKTLTVNGDYIQFSGTTMINNGKLIVNGSLRMQSVTTDGEEKQYGKSTGNISMTSADDYIYVAGDIICDKGGYNIGTLSNGVIELKGDIDTTYFSWSGDNKLVLSGDDSQNIGRGTGSSIKLASVELNNTSDEGIKLIGKVSVTANISQNKKGYSGTLLCESGARFSDGKLIGNVKFEDNYTFAEDVTIYGNVQTSGDITVPYGLEVVIDNNLTSYKALNIAGTLEVGGNYLQRGFAKLNMNKGSFVVRGDADLSGISSTGISLKNASDYIHIYGDLDITSSSGIKIENGTIEAGGDVNISVAATSVISKNSKLVFSGYSLQTIALPDNVTWGTIELKNYSEAGVYSDKAFLKTKLIRNGCRLKYGDTEGEFGWKLTGDQTWEGDLIILEDTLDLNGYTLTVTGNLIQQGGDLDVNSGKLVVNGDYRMQTITKSEDETTYSSSAARLVMDDDNDYVIIEGNYYINTSGSHKDCITTGIIELKGNMYVEEEAANYYLMSDEATLMLSGENGQLISIDEGRLALANVDDNNTSDNKTAVSGELLVQENLMGKGFADEIYITSDTTFTDNTYNGDVVLENKYTVPGYKVTINGNCRMAGNYVYMSDEASHLYVNGNLVLDNSVIGIDKGKLELTGDLIVNPSQYSYKINGINLVGTNVFVMSGSSRQSIIQSQPDEVELKFNTLELRNACSEGVYSDYYFYCKKLVTNNTKLTNGSLDYVAGYKLSEDTTITGDLNLGWNTLDLNGYTLTVTGDVVNAGATIHLNGGTLDVGGNYRQLIHNISDDSTYELAGYGSLIMNNTKDKLNVSGDIKLKYLPANNVNSSLTKGVINLKGDLYHTYSSINSYKLNIGATVNLDGHKPQKITGNITFDKLNLNNKKEIIIANNITVNDELSSNCENITGAGEVVISGFDVLKTDTYNGSLTLGAADVLDKDITIEGTLKTNYTLQLNEHMLTVDNLELGGSLYVDEGSLNCVNDLNIGSSAKLIMTNQGDVVTVGGNITYSSSYNHSTYLTAGEIYLKGDFSSKAKGTFAPSGTHRVILEKKNKDTGKAYIQTVEFLASDTTSKFNTLVLKKAEDEYVFSRDLDYMANEVVLDVPDYEELKPVENLKNTSLDVSTITIEFTCQDEERILGYEIYRDGVKVGATGTTTYVDTDILPESTYTYEVYGFDKYWNYTTTSPSITITTPKDDLAPSKPVDLSVTDITGGSINLVWSASSDNDRIRGYNVYRDEAIIDFVTEGSQYHDTGLNTNMEYTYRVSAVDRSGNESELSEYVSARPRTPNITNVVPKDGEWLEGEELTLQMEFDKLISQGKYTVDIEYYDNETYRWVHINSQPIVPSDINSITCKATISWNIAQLLEEEVEVRYVVRDSEGFTGSKTVTYFVDSTPPEAPGSVSILSDNGVIKLSWDVSAEYDCVGYKVYRRILGSEGKFQLIHTIADKYTSSYNDISGVEGTLYEYVITAYDNNHNESSYSECVKAKVTGDTVAPVVEEILPETGRINATTKLNITASDNRHVDQVKLYIIKDADGESEKHLADVTLSDGGGSYTLDTTDYDDGIYYIRAVAVDGSGNESEEKYVRRYEIDNTGISKIVLDNCSVEATYVSLRWKDVIDSDFSYFQVEQLIQGKYVAVGTSEDVLGLNVTRLQPDTSYSFRVVGYDDLGNRGTCSDVYEVKTKSDAIPPVIKAVYPVQGDYSDSLKLKVSGTDNDMIAGARFYYSYDGESFTLITDEKNKFSDSELSYLYKLDSHPEGKIYIKFEIYDKAGNINATTADGEEIICEYNIDRTAPDKPQDLVAINNPGNIELNWSASDDVAYYKIYRAGQENGVFSVIKGNHKYVNYYDTDLECGQCYMYKITAVDKAGNESEYSDTVVASAAPDVEKPIVKGVLPKEGATVGETTHVKITSTDNSKLSGITVDLKNNETGAWNQVYSDELANKNSLSEFDLDLSGMEPDEYVIRIAATDKTGNKSDYYYVRYNLDTTPPQMEYSVTTGDFCIDIALVGEKPEDFSRFEVLRRKRSDIEDFYSFETIKTVRYGHTEYKDTDIEPWQDYEYKLKIYDTHGNIYETPVTVCHATDYDTVAPVISVPSHVRTLEGMEICVDTGMSYDNVRIDNFTWEISDGTVTTGKLLKHTFKEEGEYTIKVTAEDFAGNSSTEEIKVQVLSVGGTGVVHIKVADDVGNALPYSYVYLNDTLDSSVCYMTDSQGMLTLATDVGIYQAAAYKANYIPKDITIEVSEYEEKTYYINLPKGDIIVGDITISKMTLDEMESAGVDFSSPANCNQFVINVTLGFADEPIKQDTISATKSVEFYDSGGIGAVSVPITDSEGGGIGDIPGGPGVGGSGSSNSNNGELIILDSEEPGAEPVLVYLNTTQTVSWLKDMYNVNLQVYNTADYQYVVENSEASIALPGGLSLADTIDGQSEVMYLGDIYGQEGASVNWIVAGDEPGSYEIKASFDGTLMPFNQHISADFVSEQTVEVDDYEGVTIYISPEQTTYSDNHYYIQFQIENNSGRDLYNLTTTFGEYTVPEAIVESEVYDPRTGETTYYSSEDDSEQVVEEANKNMQSPVINGQESLRIKVLPDGGSVFGTYCCMFPSEKSESEFYYKLTESMASCVAAENWGVEIVVEPIPGHISKTMYTVEYEKPLFGDPVNVITGAYTDAYNAMSITGDNTLALNLEYNSSYSDVDCELGYGWCHNFESYIDAKNGMIHYYTSPYEYASFLTESSLDGVKYGTLDGNSLTLQDNPGNQDIRYRSITKGMDGYVLVRKADGTYELTTPAGYVYAYDEEGRLTSMTIDGGDKAIISHGDNQVIVTEEASGNYLKLTYNDGKLIRVADNTGRSSSFAYTDGYLTSITNPKGDTVSYEYDSDGRLTVGKNSEGEAFVTNVYDNESRVTAQYDSCGEKTTFEYMEVGGGLATTMTRPDGSQVTTNTDPWGNITYVISPSGAVTAYEYDKQGNRIKASDAYGNCYSYGYDAKGNLTHYDMNGESVIDLSYDESGNVISIASDTGNPGSYTYDDRGNIIRATDGQMSYSYNYDDKGNITSIARDGRGTSVFTYDEEGVYLKSITEEDGSTSYLDYDSRGNLIMLEDGEGVITRYSYDKLNRVVSRTNPDGGIESYTYDEYSNITSYTDPMGYKTTYEYDAGGRHLSTTYADGTTEKLSYDGVGNLITITASDGRKVYYEYDLQGNVTKVTYPDGTYEEYSYDMRGQLTSATDVSGNIMELGYDSTGTLSSLKSAEGKNITPEFAQGRSVSKVTDDSGRSTSIVYDSYGNILSMTDAMGDTSSYTYSPWGELLTETDPNGNVTTYTYDQAGRCVSVTNPDDTVIYADYDSCGRVSSKYMLTETGARYGVSYTYDTMNRVSTYTDELGNTTSYQYDLNGNLIKATDSEGAVTEYTYDCMGKVLQEQTASGIVIAYSYNKKDLVEQVVMTSATGEEKVYSYTYDDMGRVLTVTDPSGYESSQSYDLSGNITELVYPEGGGISYTYDSYGRVTKERLSIGTSSTYEYNADSLLSRYTNGRGQDTKYIYDVLGRISSISDDIGTASYTYDSNGNVLTVSETTADGKTSTISRSYDCMDRVTSYTDYRGNTVKYSYDELGNLISLTYPGGEIVRYTYDQAGLLTTVTDEEGFVTSYTYDKVGRLHTTTKPDGSVETNTYDKLSQLTERKVVSKDGQLISKYSYTYDSWGNIVSISYDSTETDETALTTTYQQNSLTGRDNKTEGAATVSMTYDSSNRMITYNGEDILYDDDGNMLYGPLDGVMTEFEYDCRNRLVRAGDTYYEYDTENVRTAVETPEYREEYITDSVSSLSRVLVITREYKTKTLDGNSSTDNKVETETYYYGNGLIYERSSEVGLLVYHYNHLGSTTAITNEAGKLVYSYDYGTYGELTSTTEYGTTTPIIRFLYNGQLGVSTDDNGLYYMRSRYYNPEIKRFINQDVLIGSIGNSNSLNRYSYVEGNPVSYTDPFGLSPYQWVSNIIHTALDIAGIFFPGADFANAVIYALEGNWIEAGKCLVFMIPGSDLLGKGAVFASKLGKGEDIVMGVFEFVDIGGHLGAPMLAAYDTGNMASDMIDKYLVNEAELSAETALEVAFLVAGAYQTYGYANILSNSVWANGVTDMVTPDVSTTGGTEGGTSSRYDRTGYQSTGRSNNLFGRDRSTKKTINLTEWRRNISKQDIHDEMRLFLGDDYVKVDSGKWRSLDGNRQFRVKPDDYLGNHGIGQPTVPNTPHVHFEFLTPRSNGNGFDVIKNIHVPLID